MEQLISLNQSNIFEILFIFNESKEDLLSSLRLNDNCFIFPLYLNKNDNITEKFYKELFCLPNVYLGRINLFNNKDKDNNNDKNDDDSNKLNQFNQKNKINQVNEINTTNEIKETDEINGYKKAKKLILNTFLYDPSLFTAVNIKEINPCTDFILIKEQSINQDRISSIFYQLFNENYFKKYTGNINMNSFKKIYHESDNIIETNDTIKIKIIKDDLTLKEKATNDDTYKYIHEVIKGLLQIQEEINKRIMNHDKSKLTRGEVEIFTEFSPLLKETEYGSDEYKELLNQIKPALINHYNNNRHHPEYFNSFNENQQGIIRIQTLINQLKEKREAISWLNRGKSITFNHNQVTIENNMIVYLIELLEEKKKELTSSINNMNLVDILEMLIDWNASTKRTLKGDIYKSLDINKTRFYINQQLINILRNTIQLII